MKKTLTTLLAAAFAVSGIAAADSYTLSPNTSLTVSHGTYSGWVGSLSDAYLTSSTSLAEDVYLSQISITTPADGGEVGATAKLSIFEYSSVGAAGTFVAISSNTATFAHNGALTFDFSNIELDSTKNYRFAFVAATATETMNSPWQNVGASMRIQVANIASLGTNDDKGMTSNGNAGGWSSHEWMPNVTYTLSNKVVPEPTTATLSLLALAGLTARRRRK